MMSATSSASSISATTVQDTSSPASSKSTPSGPSRFRGDAASFSPGQQKLNAINSLQHPHHQHHPQHHMQPRNPSEEHQPHIQQLYSQAQPYMSHQQQMQYMLQYDAYQPVVYPSMYLPMYNHEIMYQNQMYMMQQQSQIPQVPHHYPPHFNQSIPQNNPRKRVNGNQYAAKVSTAPKFIPSALAALKSPVRPPTASGKIDNKVTTPTNNTTNDIHETSNVNKTESKETTKVSTPSPEPIVPVEKENTEEPPSIVGKVETPVTITPSEPILSYPVFFNSSLDEFNKGFNSSQRKQLINDKYKRLKAIKSDKSFTIETGSIKLINYNTGETNIINEGINEEPKIDAPTVNWASILTSSTPKKHTTKSKASNGSAIEPQPQSPVTAPAITEVNFDIRNEVVQPLGILLLRIMFDPHYSVLNTDNDFPVFKITPRGLTNTGNICYMNSILQVLIYCQPFNKLLKLVNDKSIGTLSKLSSTPLLDASIKFLNEFISEPDTDKVISKSFTEANKPISPDNFYMNLISHEKFQHLKWGQQEDAEEFLGYFLDGLNEEFLNAIKQLSTSSIDSLIQSYANENEAEKTNQFKFDIKTSIKIIKNDKTASPESTETDNEWNEVGSNKKISVKRTVEIEPTPITMIFGGQFKSVLTIPKAPNSSQYSKSITLDPFQHVQLDISESSSIEEAFAHLNNVEKISYKTKEQKDIQIKKQTFIDKLPEVLIIHLKRFSFLKEKEVGIEKLRKKIVYTHGLTINPDILSNKNSNAVYKLTGIVYHHGANAQGGHYTSDVLSQENGEEWIRIDDTMLKLITDDEVLNGGVEENIKNAYILIYQHETSE